MFELATFDNERFGEIRTIDSDGTIWFVASDVCKALEISNPSMALERLDEDERSKFNLGRQGMANVVNEYGLYGLVLGSRKKEAKDFQRWIKHEVLPSIRKTGGYQMQTNKPIKMSEVFQAMAETAKIAEDASETAHAAMNGVTRLTAAQDAIEASVSSMDKKLDNVVDVLSAPKTTEAERWQRETHKAITSFCQENSLNYHDCYDGLYEQLEEQAHVSLAIRVKNRKDRAKAQGASAAEMRGITKLFCISIDAKLRIIFDNLVKEFKIAHTLKGGVC